MKQLLATDVISFEEFHSSLQTVNSVLWYESAARPYCGSVVTAASDAALTPAPALGSRLVSYVIIVILVTPDSCDEDTTSSIESMSFTSIGTAGSAVEVLAPTLTPRAAALQRYLQSWAMAPHFVWHFVFFLPTPGSYIVLHIFFANVATLRS
jgi:hypothetical protein